MSMYLFYRIAPGSWSSCHIYFAITTYIMHFWRSKITSNHSSLYLCQLLNWTNKQIYNPSLLGFAFKLSIFHVTTRNRILLHGIINLTARHTDKPRTADVRSPLWTLHSDHKRAKTKTIHSSNIPFFMWQTIKKGLKTPTQAKRASRSGLCKLWVASFLTTPWGNSSGELSLSRLRQEREKQ